jgi:hypothetical protein
MCHAFGALKQISVKGSPLDRGRVHLIAICILLLVVAEAVDEALERRSTAFLAGLRKGVECYAGGYGGENHVELNLVVRSVRDEQ